MGKGKQTSVQKSEPWAPAQGALKGVLGDAQSLYQSGGFQIDPFQGNRVAGFSAPTQQSHQMISQLAGGPNLSQQAGSTLSGLMDPSQYGAGLEGVKQEALGSAIPAAAAQFSGSGLTDSSTAQQGVGRAAAQAVAPIEYQAYNQAQNRALQAAGMSPAIQQASYLPAQMLGQIGGQQQQQDQAQIDAQRSLYQEQQRAPIAGLENYAALIGGIGGQGGLTTGSAGRSTGLGDIISGGLGLASLFSDRRLKKDVKKIGNTAKGHNLYEFKYLWSDDVRVGVMADEVPHAIAGQIGGYNVVDYGKVI